MLSGRNMRVSLKMGMLLGLGIYFFRMGWLLLGTGDQASPNTIQR